MQGVEGKSAGTYLSQEALLREDAILKKKKTLCDAINLLLLEGVHRGVITLSQKNDLQRQWAGLDGSPDLLQFIASIYVDIASYGNISTSVLYHPNKPFLVIKGKDQAAAELLKNKYEQQRAEQSPMPLFWKESDEDYPYGKLVIGTIQDDLEYRISCFLIELGEKGLLTPNDKTAYLRKWSGQDGGEDLIGFISKVMLERDLHHKEAQFNVGIFTINGTHFLYLAANNAEGFEFIKQVREDRLRLKLPAGIIYEPGGEDAPFGALSFCPQRELMYLDIKKMLREFCLQVFGGKMPDDEATFMRNWAGEDGNPDLIGFMTSVYEEMRSEEERMDHRLMLRGMAVFHEILGTSVQSFHILQRIYFEKMHLGSRIVGKLIPLDTPGYPFGGILIDESERENVVMEELVMNDLITEAEKSVYLGKWSGKADGGPNLLLFISKMFIIRQEKYPNAKFSFFTIKNDSEIFLGLKPSNREGCELLQGWMRGNNSIEMQLMPNNTLMFMPRMEYIHQGIDQSLNTFVWEASQHGVNISPYITNAHKMVWSGLWESPDLCGLIASIFEKLYVTQVETNIHYKYSISNGRIFLYIAPDSREGYAFIQNIFDKLRFPIQNQFGGEYIGPENRFPFGRILFKLNPRDLVQKTLEGLLTELTKRQFLDLTPSQQKNYMDDWAKTIDYITSIIGKSPAIKDIRPELIVVNGKVYVTLKPLNANGHEFLRNLHEQERRGDWFLTKGAAYPKLVFNLPRRFLEQKVSPAA